MAIGFTPKHSEKLILKDLTEQQFLALANTTLNELGWVVNFISETGLIAYTNNGTFSWNAEFTIKIEDGFAELTSASTGSEFIDWNKNKNTVFKFISKVEELSIAYTNDELSNQYTELVEQFVSPEEDVLKLPPATTSEKVKDFFSIFKPTGTHFINPIIININILVFILMLISGVDIIKPDNVSLLNWGANFRPYTLDGQWWRLLTNCFLHIGIIHLIFNMYALLYIGVLLEPILGRTRYSFAYILTGISASVVSLWWHDLTISAGASGAIFGMYGVFLALLTSNLLEKKTKKALTSSIFVFVGYNLAIGLKSGIDNSAHIGGLLSGVIIGYAMLPSLKNYENHTLKIATVSLLSVIFLTASTIVVNKLPNDLAIYQKKMVEFDKMESIALEVFNFPKDTPKEDIINYINEKGKVSWKKNIEIIESAKFLDLPEDMIQRNILLLEYCELRLKSFELIAKYIEEEDQKYLPMINQYNLEIDDKVKEIKINVE